MKKIINSLPSLVIVGLSCCVLLLSWTVSKTKHEKKWLQQLAADKEELLEFYARQVRYNNNLQGHYSTIQLNDSQNKPLLFSSFVHDAPKLFFRFTEQNCTACIEAEIPKLKALAKIIGKDKIVVLTSNEPGSKAIQFIKRNYQLEFPIFDVAQDQLKSLEIEGLNTPYLFVGDSNGLRNFFVPEKSLPELSDIYYSAVANAFLIRFANERPQDNLPTSKIKFERNVIDFKDIHYEHPVIGKYQFTNNGVHPLQLIKVVPDCNCMVSEWPRYLIQPGDSAEISIRYNANTVGKFEKTIKVFANIDTPIVLRAQGTVIQ